jgi:tRNA-dihydrouridine synthase 3
MGCPIDIICNKGAGSALMGRRNRLRGVVAAAVHTLDVPVTVKIRTGIDREKKLAHNLIPLFQKWGVSAVTLHGRSRQQRYTKLADWDYIKQCAGLVDQTQMQFIGNGDIFNPEDFNDTLAANPNLATAMVG